MDKVSNKQLVCALFLVWLATMAILIGHYGDGRTKVVFSNDGPLAMLAYESSNSKWAALDGNWDDIHWVGNESLPSEPSVSTLFKLFSYQPGPARYTAIAIMLYILVICVKATSQKGARRPA